MSGWAKVAFLYIGRHIAGKNGTDIWPAGLNGQSHEFFVSGFFHLSASPGPSYIEMS